MSSKAYLKLRGRNPDVLTCIANLSNDEVFTPPEFANQVLDTLSDAWAESNHGANIWADKNVTFLDPCTKSGIFLREITARLSEGLAPHFPDIQERITHILTNQVFGIGITHLTTLLARRSLYCSKHANGPHSVAKGFSCDAGNIWFKQQQHDWVNGKCTFCGASQTLLDRGESRETYAYAFIHTNEIQTKVADVFGGKVQFDVIIGNPPYQLDDGGFGASAVPIYNKFVEQAKALEPRFLTMIIPSRWLFGGRGLDDFRKSMLNDRRIRILCDYPDSRMVFPSVDVAGGICYFLWQRDNPGDCKVIEYGHGLQKSECIRPLLEDGAEVFIRNSRAIAILRKIASVEHGGETLCLPEDRRFDEQVSSQKPFGLRTFFRGSERKTNDKNILVIQSGGRGWIARSEAPSGEDMIDKWKVFTSKSSSEHAGQVDKNGQRRVLSLSGILPPGSVVTETYIILGCYDTEEQAKNCFSYVCTKFFRFLIAVRSSAQDLSRSAYSFVPLQDFSMPWRDEMLYSKYGLTKEEIDLIESSIRPMQINDE